MKTERSCKNVQAEYAKGSISKLKHKDASISKHKHTDNDKIQIHLIALKYMLNL